ncbi:bifunctional thymidylate/uridylate kinase [Cyberlindnera jadinii NRRL Y-1542]|uniref:Thymidylate kinase n=1 Tax=Cyberlindnera jadinii (strain ATCC 18201 / CBS 1600 / BCRC 20928 / JCM 3617 / NBRC 0987 / NRRL Y-1542) TaxID=983966 RepID=A0A1E4S2L5_CYBJN|nr:thymidylate and uridylate kinase [Cyberlindnera jadinii NRRL Y-1542]ODV73748.1 thymidylate and uridylate kinase [Cyberlindnera jadinii NRRL Y-1542]
MGRGALILVEGLDRAGKTTQTSELVTRLRNEGLNVELIKFPDRTTPIGKLINSYLVDKSFELSDESAHLLFSANRWELSRGIKEKLHNGTIVVLDRYVYSGVAYTAAKGLDAQWCLNPDIGLPRPDLTIFLNLNDSQSSRGGFGDERYEVTEFQQQVKLQFEKFFNEPNWNTLVVDGKNIQDVAEEVWPLVQEVLSKDLKQVELF